MLFRSQVLISTRMSSLVERDFLPLWPLLSLSLIYWVRDRYLFNRVPGKWYVATKVQLQVLLFVYPVWVFLQWTTGIQSRRGQAISLFTTTGSHLAGHLATVAILNDSFLQSKQQIISMMIGLSIAYLWTVFNMTAFYSDECQISNVEGNDSGCNCNGTT